MRQDVRYITLNMLVVLEALCVHRNTVKVAQQLNITQPAVSQCLKRLRAIAGDPLFVRTQNGLEPTPQCLALRDHAITVLDICERIVTSGAPEFDPAKTRHRFTVSIPQQKTQHLFHVLGILLSEKYPSLSVDITSLPEADGLAALSAGALDLFIGFSGKQVEAAYRSEKITSFNCKVICSNQCPLYPQGKLEKSTFLNTPHVKVSQGLDNTLLDGVLQSLGLMQKTLILVPDKESAYELVRQNNCLFMVDLQTAEKLCHQDKNLKILQEDFSLPSIDIYQVWDARRDVDPANAWLRKYIRENCHPGPLT